MLWNGNECEKKTEVMGISRKLPPEQIRIQEKQQEYIDYFSILVTW